MVDSYKSCLCAGCGRTIYTSIDVSECHVCAYKRTKQQLEDRGLRQPADQTADKRRALVAESLGRHMSNSEERCELCRFWLANEAIDGASGRCRRYPLMPVVLGKKERKHVAYIAPLILASDWCGEFRDAKGGAN